MRENTDQNNSEYGHFSRSVLSHFFSTSCFIYVLAGFLFDPGFPTLLFLYRSSHRRCSVEKVFLEISQNSQENTCARVPFLIKKETPAQVFSCEFCEISKNTFSAEHLRWLLLSLNKIRLNCISEKSDEQVTVIIRLLSILFPISVFNMTKCIN